MSARAVLAFLGTTLGTRRSVLATVVPIAAFAAWIAWVDPGGIDQAIAMTLFAQMFAAATGYRERARRGHFDPVLTLGWPRGAMAAAHGLLSFAPGAVAWVLVAAAVWLVRRGVCPSSLTVSGLVAFVYVSCVAWASALPLTRYVSGVIWIVGLFVLGGGGHISSLRETFLTTDHRVMATLAKTGAAAICPFFLLSDPEGAGPPALALLLFLAALIALCGARFIVYLDAPLGERS